MADKKVIVESDITAKQMSEFWSQVASGVINRKNLQEFLEVKKTSKASPRVNPQPKNLDTVLGYEDFSQFMQKDGLERKLKAGSYQDELIRNRTFFQQYYGSDYNFDWKEIFVKERRLPAIKKGLEVGAVNTICVKPIPTILTSAQADYNANQFFCNEILQKSGMNIWGNTGRDRWTKLTLDEYLAECIDVLPEDFNAFILRKDWKAECLRIAEGKGLVPKIIPGSIEIFFVYDGQDIPSNQKYVNQIGEVVEVDDCSFITAVENNIKLVTAAEEMILGSQIFSETGKYLATNTWEFNSSLLKHSGVNPVVSVALADDCDSGFRLDSDNADGSSRGDRFRLSL
jgi:hypothetical protein